jgi:hypothetical protein
MTRRAKILSIAAERLVRRKPLFIPLKTKYFEAFENGTKTTELRVYGSRWNEKTCYVGREVVLSKGYGKKSRLEGLVVDIEVVPARELPKHRTALLDCYGHLDMDIIIIHIQTPPLRLL